MANERQTKRDAEKTVKERTEVAMHRPERPPREVAREAAQEAERKEKTLARARGGDQAAFAELVREHQSMVFSLAHHFFRNRTLAEDIAQEVFLHLYQNLGSIESTDHVRYWLRRVTGHRCIDYARKQKMQTVSVEEAPEPASVFDQPDTILRTTLRRLVATLPEKPRLVITLRYQEDLDPTEIARVLDMPVNTVKSHLRRSLVILREKVTRSLGEVEV